MELKDLLINKLKALYDIESVIIDNLPSLTSAVSDSKLRMALEMHVGETKEQSKRLEEAFKLLGGTPERLEADAIRGLVKDAEWVVENIDEGDLRDLNIIAAASYVEHYEMAGYQSAILWAEKLEKHDVADLLNMSFTEEEAADGKLQDLATTLIERVS